jgi:hypothetical protein
MLQEHIPVWRRLVEAFHLCLNTGNHAYEVMRNALHYYLLPDGSVRDRANSDPENWPAPNSGPIQSKEWLELGLNFQAHVEAVFGAKMMIPLIKLHRSGSSSQSNAGCGSRNHLNLP